MNRLAAAVFAVALSACPPPIDTGDGGDGPIQVGPNGGIFIRAGYGLNVPRGAVSSDTTISVTIVDTGVPEVPNRKRISYGYRFSPSALKFNSPVTLYLPWVDERVPEAVDPGTFDMRRQAGSEAYAQLPGTKTDTDPFKAVEAQTERLGLFWVTSPTEPNIARLEITPKEATLRVGDTQQFTARVVAPTGETIDTPVTWGQAPARVGTIDPKGLFTAKDPGTITIVARAGSQVANAKAFVQGSLDGPSTWLHQNPFPTGNDLYGGAVAPAALGTIFVGENGTVLARAGDQWTRLFSSPNVTFTAVGGTTPDNAVAIGRLGTSGVLVEFKGTAAPAYKVFPPTQISDLVSLWFDGTHGMGVGVGNDVVIRRDGQWTTEYHPSFEKLLSVIGDGLGGFVVVGDLGSLYRWDPVRKVWDSLFDRRLAVKLDAAQLVDFATTETWAVGGNKLWHFTGGAWVAENLPATPVLTQATALARIDGHLVIGGLLPLAGLTPPPARGALLIRSSASPTDGGVDLVSWTSQLMRGQQVPRGAFGAGTEGYVVGDLGAVWSWDSTAAQFTELSHGFQGDVADLAVLSSEVYAAVNECADVRCLTRSGRLMHGFGSGQWETVGAPPFTGEVIAVAARNSNEVLVSTATGLFRWDGSNWTNVPLTDSSEVIFDLQYCGDTLWAAGRNGAVYRGSATQLAAAGSAAASDVRSLHCPSGTELWAAGDNFLSTRQTNGTWQARTSEKVNQAPWRAVWSPGPGEGLAFGDSRYGVYFDTAQLTAQESLGVNVDVVNGMWGTKIDNLVMVGRTQLPLVTGFAVRFDGINWRLVDLGARRMATAIHGTSPTNVWIGTEGGGVLKAVVPP